MKINPAWLGLTQVQQWLLTSVREGTVFDLNSWETCVFGRYVRDVYSIYDEVYLNQLWSHTFGRDYRVTGSVFAAPFLNGAYINNPYFAEGDEDVTREVMLAVIQQEKQKVGAYVQQDTLLHR